MRTDTEIDTLAVTDRQRVRAELPVRLYEGDRNCFSGVTRDISISGFRVFLNRDTSDHSDNEADPLSVDLNKLLENLSEEGCYSAIDAERKIITSALRVIRTEPSSREDFEIFAVFQFDELTEDDWKAVTDYSAKTPTVEAETQVIWRGPRQAEPSGKVSTEHEDVHVVFRARYFYIAYMRDLCDKLATEMGFEHDEVFELKLAMDEVLTNALEHGCSHYGEDRVDVRISFIDDGMSINVRDPGGKSFDHTRYRGGVEADPGGVRSGLCLIDKFMDSWEVNTNPDKYTEVIFFKKKTRKEAG
jgi:anti-sigma regulatory factor (Ser/Thr protein kinase)